MSNVEKRFRRLLERKERASRQFSEAQGRIKGVQSELKKMGIDPKKLDSVIVELEKANKCRRVKLEKALVRAEGVLDEYESSK